MTYYQKGSCARLIKTQNGLTYLLFDRKMQYSNFLFLHFTFVFHLYELCFTDRVGLAHKETTAVGEGFSLVMK